MWNTYLLVPFALGRMNARRAAGLLAKTVAGGLLLLAIGCGGAPEAPAPSPAPEEPTPAATATREPIPPRSAALGEMLETKEWRITLDKVETVALAEMDDPTAPSGPDAPANILVAYLTIRNLSADDAGINLNDFQLVTAGPDYLPALNCCQAYSMRANTLWINYGTNFSAGGSNTFLLFFGLAPDAKPALLQFLKGGLQWEFAGG